MVDKLHVMIVKPKFVGMQEQEKVENRRNLVGTALGAGAVIGGMSIANEISKTQRGQRVSEFVATSAPVKKSASLLTTAKDAVATQIQKPGSILNKISNAVGGVAEYVKAMPKTVKVIGGAALATVAALHVYDKGRIKDKFQGYHSANELADKASEAVYNIMDKTAEVLGMKGK